ncbi:protein SIEVE ELEMENT OCCLUSION B-like isoform X2 [Andrographis paniculata]|uniref:protein SIEVE ELEMENT OCCLUSION B-like isoform X2 n=1 Tax=Andrographis paniculata TaxID=175694 RepID=UPI0021E73D70|nr:protein SIEVE ELEMENT OCCLUSION B-like isoform X2 [Andrographis paniculata]
MERREFVPASRAGLPRITEKPAASASAAAPKPAAGGLMQYAPDPIAKHVDEPDHNPSTPKLVPAAAAPAASVGGVPTRGQTLRRDRDRHFFSSDDNALSKQIVATHAPDFEDLDARPVLAIVEDILHLAKPLHGTQTQLHKDPLEDRALHQPSLYHHDEKLHSTHSDERLYRDPEHESDIVKLLAYPINKISCEIICKCSGGGESHSVTMELLKSLSSYAWDAKVVITFAAFAINYGEFWLVEHLHTKDPLAKNIAALKDLPDLMTNAGELQKKFEAVLGLLNAALKVSHCIIEFKELPPLYISRESPEITAATAHIPTAVYWIIRSLLVCSSTLLSLIGTGAEYLSSTAESWEILSLTHKLQVIMEHLQTQLRLCKGLVEKKKEEDAYVTFVRIIESAHIDNMKVLRAMFRSKEDQRPLYDGTRKINERLEALRLKYVLLLISDLDLPHEELNVLHMIYNQQAMRHEYEVLWFPIVDPISSSQGQLQDSVFYDLRNNHMPWYSVDHHSLVEPVAIRYIRDVWKFVHTPMLVVLDPQGKPSNLDALPMMWIWGSTAFPFTKARESALWSESTWNIDLLADAIDPRIPDWIREQKVICLYGGEDIDWIRKFTLTARSVARDLKVDMEMLYVGKRNPRDKVRRCHEIIDREKLSHVFSVADYYDYVWYFWVRLWSMWNSKRHIGMTVDSDRIMQEIMDVLTFDSSDQGWAVFSRGNYEITKGNGEKLLPVLDNYQDWAYQVDHPDKFVTVLDEQLRGLHPEHHCNRLILPGHAGYIPERVVCSECGKTMDKYVMYRCCTD